eukprot:101037_1
MPDFGSKGLVATLASEIDRNTEKIDSLKMTEDMTDSKGRQFKKGDTIENIRIGGGDDATRIHADLTLGGTSEQNAEVHISDFVYTPNSEITDPVQLEELQY